MQHLDVVGLLKAAQTLERNVSVALMYAGLRLPQFRLLDTLAEMGQATVSEMSEKLHITRATASVMCNDLLRSGAVAVVENPSDRRSFYIRLTELGSDKLHVARSDLGVLMNKLAQRYPQDMIQVLNEFAGMTGTKT
jgi:MarR family transcriptional regulator, 2-MHQ and catechol-resistance regulon repressor